MTLRKLRKNREYNNILKNAQQKSRLAVINKQIQRKNYVYKANRNFLIKCDINIK